MPRIKPPEKQQLSREEILKMLRNKGRAKYHNERCEIDGIWFDSKKEGKRYGELKMLEKARAIRDLRIQQRFVITVNGRHICDYIADFEYTDSKTGQQVVEDVKGVRTKEYQIKRKLVEALYNITILET